MKRNSTQAQVFQRPPVDSLNKYKTTIFFFLSNSMGEPKNTTLSQPQNEINSVFLLAAAVCYQKEHTAE